MFEDFKIKVFITVASEGSFTKAASVLGISQPAVSQNIAELERQSGTKLFIRERGIVVLTDEGRVFLKYAEKAIALGMSANTIFLNLPPKQITINASDELWVHFLVPILEDFNKVHPSVTFLRTNMENADMNAELVPASMLGTAPTSIAKVRVSLCNIPSSANDYAFNHEKTFTFDLCLIPAPSFAESPHYPIIRATIHDFINL